jgi:matrixin
MAHTRRSIIALTMAGGLAALSFLEAAPAQTSTARRPVRASLRMARTPSAGVLSTVRRPAPISTHEWGHAFGLAHETSGADQVMYPYKNPCELRRHLGKGDYAGMNAMY